tara:strand:+ start:110 stop:292 length:183 start_codon:yes stop_codon:yes gene_type:complete
MELRPTLIKDRLPNVKDEKYGPIDEDTYIKLYDEGYIEDEYNIIKKKQKSKKAKETNNLD